jgi:hypothetical protein
LRALLYFMPSLYLGAAVAGGALAQEKDQDRTQVVIAPPDAKTLTETGSLSATETMTYTIDAKSGHSASVTFKSNNAKCGFVVYGPGQTPGENAAMFESFASGNQFSGFLPSTGTYLVRVALNRDAARNQQTCDYTVTFAVAR